MTSQRQDGRGHWTKGRRRHADKGDWAKIRLAMVRFVEDNRTPGTRAGKSTISYAALARDLGVSQRTVVRWAKGEDRPDEATQEAVQQWIVERREELKKKRNQ